MRVDERRRQQQTLGLDDAMCIRPEIRAERGDDPVVDAHVERRIDSPTRVEHARATDDDVLPGAVPGEQHQATSSTVSVLTPTGPLVSRS